MNSTNLANYNNKFYRPGSIFKRAAWFLFNLLVFKSSLFPFYTIKVLLLKLFGASIGRGLIIKPGVSIKYPWFLRIGDFCWIGENVWIDNLAMVEIGNHVCISQGALLLCGNHDYNKPGFDLIVQPIVLEDGVWIGAKAIVCPGIICHNHAVLAAGSVASDNLASYSIYNGNPCTKIKDRNIK